MKIPAAEKLLRRVIDNAGGVDEAIRTQGELDGMDPCELGELADSCNVLMQMCVRALPVGAHVRRPG